MNDFFGHRLDLRSIGLFRICLAAILIVDLFYYRLNFYDIFYSNEGFLDHSLWQTMIHEGQDLWIWNWSLFSSFEGAWFAVLVILLCILSAVFFGIGIWPRFWGTVLLIGYFSLLQRNPLITSTHERLLIVFLIFALVLPVEKMFCYKSKKSGEEIFSYEYRGIPVVVFLLYMSLFYFLNAFLKDGESWAGGEAIRFAIKGNLHIKPWVSHLSIIDSWLNNLTFFIRGFEFSLAALLLLPSKKAWPQVIAAFLILLFHLFLFLFFSFGIFPLILSLTSVLLIPGVFWDLIYKKLKIVTRRMLPPLKATSITIGFSIFI